MTNYARIINDVAVDVSTAPEDCFHPDIAAEFVAVPDQVRSMWRRVDGEWQAPPAFEPPTIGDPVNAAPIITRLAFRRRFTMGEKTAIEMAALDQPNASSAVRLQSAQLRAFLKDADAAENITLDDDTTRAGVALLVAAGLLAAARGDEILDAPVQDAERPGA